MCTCLEVVLEGGPIWDRLASPSAVPSSGHPRKSRRRRSNVPEVQIFFSGLWRPPPPCLFACLFADSRGSFFEGASPGPWTLKNQIGSSEKLEEARLENAKIVVYLILQGMNFPPENSILYFPRLILDLLKVYHPRNPALIETQKFPNAVDTAYTNIPRSLLNFQHAAFPHATSPHNDRKNNAEYQFQRASIKANISTVA